MDPSDFPTIPEVRTAIEVLSTAVVDPDADTASVERAHLMLVDSRGRLSPIANTWIEEYLDDATTRCGPLDFRASVEKLAQRFKIAPTRRPAPIGKQGTLFD